MIDALAFEPQFLDHLAPVWSLLPDRGRLLVAPELASRASRLPDVEAIDPRSIRARPQVPATAADGPVAFVTSIGDIKVGRRLGYRRFVFMEHGAGQSYVTRGQALRHPSYPGGADRADVGLFLVPNEYSAALWRSTYPAARVEIVGCPRLDDLPRRQIDPIEPHETVAISFHWPGWAAPEAGSALGTFQPVLAALAKRFKVIGHAHPGKGWPEQMVRIYRRAGIEFVADFDEVCRRADVYACDNSSTIFEFASTGRPVVVLNAREYRKSVSHGLRFWDAVEGWMQVDDPADLGDAVAAALADPADVAAAQEAGLDIVYAHRSGGAARAVRAITGWLAERDQVAA